MLYLSPRALFIYFIFEQMILSKKMILHQYFVAPVMIFTSGNSVIKK